ncbi:MAG: bifunctional folylpolyglutamate synthase/dihydrofolate synthase [Spirochaetota bacterium]
MIETVEDGYRWFESFLAIDRGGYRPRAHRLQRMRGLLARYGDPHRATPVIHVTGSKGKGSTSAFIAAVLDAAGMRCGVFSSPHVESYRERVRVLDGSLTDEVAVSLFRRIERDVDARREFVPAAELPTTFELLTLFGFLAFRRTACDVAVVEVGMGGRIDATNVVAPIASVITPIELEHTEFLGTTLRQIAGEKGGVIKAGSPVFLGRQRDEAETTLRRIARLRGAPVESLVESTSRLRVARDRAGAVVEFELPPQRAIRARLRLAGLVQGDNAALAALVVATLFPTIPDATIARGLAAAWIPGRSEVVPGAPPVLLDGAHTPASIELLCATAADLEPDRSRRVAVFGSVRGKDHGTMLSLLAASFPRIVVTRPGTFKASDLDALAATCRATGAACRVTETAKEALEEATREPTGLIVVCGSFYLVGEARAILRTFDDRGMP